MSLLAFPSQGVLECLLELGALAAAAAAAAAVRAGALGALADVEVLVVVGVAELALALGAPLHCNQKSEQRLQLIFRVYRVLTLLIYQPWY